ncbi:unnamed protein product, partial [Mesorhabditis belari]|uniref:Uncharacterized protein n=1 Tax=Mesorhabditis belari TaxID=2138241 RepID=A0AAF3JB24_9BILA
MLPTFPDLRITWKENRLKVDDSSNISTSQQEKSLHFYIITDSKQDFIQTRRIYRKALNAVKIAQWLLGENLKTFEGTNFTFSYIDSRKTFVIPLIRAWISDFSDIELYKNLKETLKFDDRNGHLVVYANSNKEKCPNRFVTLQNLAFICGDGLISVPTNLADLKDFQCGSNFMNSDRVRAASHYILAMLHEILHVFLIPHSNTGLMNQNDVCDTIGNYLCDKRNCSCFTDLNKLDSLSIELARRSSFINGRNSDLKVTQFAEDSKLLIECLSGESIDYLLEIRNSDSSIRNVQKCASQKVEAKISENYRLLVATAVSLHHISLRNG